MDIRISKESGVPLHEQISGQLVFLIATRKLQPGETLPSIRTLARKLKVHHNTVSEALQYLVKWDLVVRRRGARLMVNDPGTSALSSAGDDLETLITAFIKTAQACGFHETEILQRVSERLSARPPDRIMALSFDAGMRRLFESELQAAFPGLVGSCSPEELLENPELAAGALLVAPPGVLPRIAALLPKFRVVVPALYTDATSYLEFVGRLQNPSIIALLSISEAFLKIARGVLGPVTSGRHSLIERQVAETGPLPVPAADVIFCDAVTARRLGKRKGSQKVFPYPLLAQECLDKVRTAISVA